MSPMTNIIYGILMIVTATHFSLLPLCLNEGTKGFLVIPLTASVKVPVLPMLYQQTCKRLSCKGLTKEGLISL